MDIRALRSALTTKPNSNGINSDTLALPEQTSTLRFFFMDLPRVAHTARGFFFGMMVGRSGQSAKGAGIPKPEVVFSYSTAFTGGVPQGHPLCRFLYHTIALGHTIGGERRTTCH